MIKGQVIVIGEDHHNTLGVVRSLGENNLKSIYLVVLNSERSFVAKSKYVKGTYYCNNDLTLFVELIELIAKDIETVLLPCSDNAALFVDECLDRLHKSTNLFGPTVNHQNGLLKNLLDKVNTNSNLSQSCFEESRIKIPKSIYFEKNKYGTLNSFFEMLSVNKLHLPIIVKPVSSVNGMKSNIQILHNELDVYNFFKIVEMDESVSYLIQEYIDKDCEYGIQGVALSDGSVYIPGIIKKIRQSVVSTGSTTYAQLVLCDEYIKGKDVEDLIKKTGFCGIFDIELMRKGNEIYLCEINYRNGAYGYAYTVAGANLPYVFLHDLYSTNFKPKNIIKPLYLINETADLYYVKTRKIGIVTWIKQLLGAKAKLLWNLKDICPFFAKIVFRL